MQRIPKFSAIARSAGIADPFWDEALREGVHGLVIEERGPAATLRIDDRDLTNMSSYSYLGLDEHPAIIEGAISQLTQSGVLNSSLSRRLMRERSLGHASSPGLGAAQ